ncbi:MAG: hypothetical protein KF752_14185 [Pirellulaceae bacterium]|nr:hypothetical protein [Pirellulaceae bacterium]
MPSSTDLTIKSVENKTIQFDYRQPMKFGGRVVNDVSVLRSEVTVTVGGKGKGVLGIGEMTMGNAWAWPSKIPSKVTLKLIIELASRLAAQVSKAHLTGDALQLTRQVSELRDKVVAEMQTQYKIVEGIPKLAAMLASSPLEAAIHDALGRSQQRSSYECLTSEFLNEDLSAYLGPDFAGKYPCDYLLSKPKPTMPLYHLVGALDPLSSDDLKTRLNDGYPETLEEWLATEGISHLKIKLAGNDVDWDVGRIVEITRICEAVASERAWKLSLDFNEQCPDEDYVIDFLERIERLSPLSHQRLQYIEQPTPRDLTIRTEMTVHRISRLLPIVIDESLTDMESLRLARKRGYTGIALKACKGHTECLLMAAAAAEHKMFVCFQDLTCIGGSFLHSASLASRISRVVAIEGNGRQYCPQGNHAYMSKYAPLFRVRYGTIPTDLLGGVGLGFEWQKLTAPPPPKVERPARLAKAPAAAAANSKTPHKPASAKSTVTHKAKGDAQISAKPTVEASKSAAAKSGTSKSGASHQEAAKSAGPGGQKQSTAASSAKSKTVDSKAKTPSAGKGKGSAPQVAAAKSKPIPRSSSTATKSNLAAGSAKSGSTKMQTGKSYGGKAAVVTKKPAKKK